MTGRAQFSDATLEDAACRGFAQGEVAERERIRTIISDDAARGRDGTAVYLATMTNMPARAAVLFLETVPRSDVPAFNVRPARFPKIKLTYRGIIDEKS